MQTTGYKLGVTTLWVLAALLWPASVMAQPGLADMASPVHQIDFAGVPASTEALHIAQWVMATGNHQGLPFALVDKKNARIHVFNGQGRLRGTSPVLLGLAPGDHALPGSGQRVVSGLSLQERTTPAGRFLSEPGRNLSGEPVVWFDYAAALAIHRVRPGRDEEQRLQRLASATPHDNRISLGCVVVPGTFYDTVVAPLLGRQHGVVYVLPETKSAHEMFGTRQAALQR